MWHLQEQALEAFAATGPLVNHPFSMATILQRLCHLKSLVLGKKNSAAVDTRMGLAAVLNTSLPSSGVERQLGRGRPCLPISTPYTAASGVASSRAVKSTSHACRYISRPFAHHKLCATVEQQSCQEVHDYIVLFKVLNLSRVSLSTAEMA